MKKHVRTILTVLLSICILLSCISVGFAAAPANENQQASREAFRKRRGIGKENTEATLPFFVAITMKVRLRMNLAGLMMQCLTAMI